MLRAAVTLNQWVEKPKKVSLTDPAVPAREDVSVRAYTLAIRVLLTR